MGPGVMYLKLLQLWMSGGVGCGFLRRILELLLGLPPGKGGLEAWSLSASWYICLGGLPVFSEINLEEYTQDIFP